MVAIPMLETPRIRLRPYKPDDFDAYAAMWADPLVTRFIGGVPMSREAAWTRFLRQIGLWHYLGFGFFALEHRATGVFIGECGFHDLRRTLDPSIEGTMEAGWVLISAMHGKGLAEEAMRAAINWAAAHGTGERLTCMIDVKHAASQHVAEKLGFREFARTSYGGKPIVLFDQPRIRNLPEPG